MPGSSPPAAYDAHSETVFSTTLTEPLPWADSILLHGSVPEAVCALKHKDGEDLHLAIWDATGQFVSCIAVLRWVLPPQVRDARLGADNGAALLAPESSVGQGHAHGPGLPACDALTVMA